MKNLKAYETFNYKLINECDDTKKEKKRCPDCGKKMKKCKCDK